MLVQQVIPNLIGGVSQVPPALRQPNQGEICDNAFPSPVDGLTKRPPSQFLAQLWSESAPGNIPASDTADAFVHWVNRDGVERYVMVLSAGTWHIHDLATGASHPIVYQFSGDSAYFIPGGFTTSRKAFRALTIGDTTYVVNTTVSTAMLGSSAFTPTVAPAFVAILWIKTATNNATYAVNINNALAASYTAPATGAVGTNTVAAGIVTALNTAGFTSGAGWNILANGSYIAISKASGAFFQIEALDSFGGTGVAFIQNNGQVNAFSGLPAYAYQGMVMTVAGDLGSSNAAKYYVQFQQNTYAASGPNFFPGPGVWVECAQSGVLTSIDPTTMPLALVRKVDDAFGTVTGIPNEIYFHVERPAWGQRVCGDLTTNPNPSFIGKSLNDIFLYQNRLGFLSDTNVTMSQSGNLTNFFRITALQLQDNDLIDITATHPRVVKLRHAVPWQQQMVIFGDLAQFVLTTVNSAAVTPTTVSLVSTTEYDTDPTVRPIPVQNLLYFPFVRQGYVGMREYYVEYYTQKHVGKDVTDVCPTYMLGSPARLASCNAGDFLSLVPYDDPTGSIFLYKWQWQGNTLYSADKLQSAWCRWTMAPSDGSFPAYVLGVQFYAQQMFVLVARITGGTAYLSLEIINLGTANADTKIISPDTPPYFYITHLDRRISEGQVTGMVYNSTLRQTTFTTPILYDPSTLAVVERLPLSANPGVVFPVLSVSGTTVVVQGNCTGLPLFIGENYTMQFRFSPLILREQQPQVGLVGMINGKTQVRTLTVRAMAASYFRLEITPAFRNKSVVVYTGNQIGSSITPIGSVPGQVENQQLRALIGANNNEVTIDLINDTHLPSRFSNAEWEAMFYSRAKRS